MWKKYFKKQKELNYEKDVYFTYVKITTLNI